MTGSNNARGSAKWLWPSVIGGLVVIGVLAISLGGGGKDKSSNSANGGGSEDKIEVAKVVEVSGTPLSDFDTTLNDSAIGKKAPTLDGVDFDGKSVTAGGASGKPRSLPSLHTGAHIASVRCRSSLISRAKVYSTELS